MIDRRAKAGVDWIESLDCHPELTAVEGERTERRAEEEPHTAALTVLTSPRTSPQGGILIRRDPCW